MKIFRQVFLGIMIALVSFGLILGAFSLSLIEGNNTTALAPTHTLTQTFSPTSLPFTPSADSPTPSSTLTPTLNLTLTPTSTPTATASLSPSPTNCPPPLGWLRYIVQSGDTLDKIATRRRISSSELQQANCLLTTGLFPGAIIYVPPLPTQTPVPCGRPFTWIVQFVQPGDTLYRLSLAYGISVGELQRANCMGSSTILHTGQLLYVPPWAPLITYPTVIVFPTATFIYPTAIVFPIATDTDTPGIMPSDTPTVESISTSTETPIPVASDTPAEVPTDTLESATP